MTEGSRDLVAILVLGFPQSGKSSVIKSVTGTSFSFENVKIYTLHDRFNDPIRVCAIHVGAREYGLCPTCYGNKIHDIMSGCMSGCSFSLFINAIDLMRRYKEDIIIDPVENVVVSLEAIPATTSMH